MLRPVLERTQGDLTVAVRQEELQTALRSFEERVSAPVCDDRRRYDGDRSCIRHHVAPKISCRRTGLTGASSPSAMQAVAALFGYQQIDTPIFEETGLFVRGVGQGTDIVDKEMYSFQDKGGADLTLRPEFTAGIMRAYIEQGMHVWPQPVKVFAIGPIFRFERPQAGRFRQHHQFDCEALGEMDPAVDLEVMSVAWTLLARLGYRRLNFQLNSTGCPKCRPAYRARLVEYFRGHEDELNDVDRRRLAINPLRLLDSKEEAVQPLLNDAPHSADYLCEECATHLSSLCAYLEALDHALSHQFPAGAWA